MKLNPTAAGSDAGHDLQLDAVDLHFMLASFPAASVIYWAWNTRCR